MSHEHEHWENDEVARRLRAEKPRLDGFELDRIKTTVMSRLRSSGRRSSSPQRSAGRSRILVALLTCGIMVGGAAGTIAASQGPSFAGSGAAQSFVRKN